MSNRKILLSHSTAILEWEKREKFIFSQFNTLADDLGKYYLEFLSINEHCKFVAEQLYQAQHPQKESYSNEHFIHAYVIRHFLKRYLRFADVCLELIKNGILPIRKLQIDILDIGSGPAPVLFALKDIYLGIRKYGQAISDDFLVKLNSKYYFLEKNVHFIEWQRQFFNIVNQIGNNYPTREFLHFDKIEIDFSKFNYQKLQINKKENLIYDYMDMDDDMSPELARFLVENFDDDWKKSYKYNFMIFSNFLNNEENIAEYQKEILSCCFSLRNGGIFVVINSGNRLDKISAQIEKIFHNFPFMHLIISENKMPCNMNSSGMFNDTISNFTKSILNIIEEHDCTEYIKKEILKKMEKEILKNEYDDTYGMLVYRKQIKKIFK